MADTIRLTVLTGPHKDSKYCFRGPSLSKIGRDPDCFVQLFGTRRDMLISRCHCRLDIDPPNIRVRDLNSSNGTYINGKKVEPADPGPAALADPADEGRSNAVLEHGDVLTVGGTTFRVDIVECPPPGTNLPEEAVWSENEVAKRNCPISC